MVVVEINMYCIYFWLINVNRDNHGGLMNTSGDKHWLISFKSGLRTPER